MPNPFPPDAVAAICRHMTEDHPADGLLIVQTLGGRPHASSAQAVDVDPDGMRFRLDDGEEVVVPFAEPATERAAVRTAVVELHARARAQAGGA